MSPAWLRKGAGWPTPRKVVALSALFLAFPLVFLIRMYTSSELDPTETLKVKTPEHYQIPSSAESIVSAVTNATLGFEKLLVLSVGPSWRTRGLEAAAKLTGLEFDILPQREKPDELVHAFQDAASGRKEDVASGRKGVDKPPFGSAKAWIAHLDLIEHFIGSGLETALVVEDDLDWDVRLRTHQMPAVVDHVRNFTGLGPLAAPSSSSSSSSSSSPYGDAWDVLWLGHCGATHHPDRTPAPLPYADALRVGGPKPHWLWEAVGWRAGAHKWTPPPDGVRQVQSSGAICSWAYGLNRRTAPRVLERAARGDNIAFDVALFDACEARELRCVVLNPAIMSSYSPPEDRGYVSPVVMGDGKGKAAEEARFEGVKGSTPNIQQSARCEALFAEECLPPQ